MPNRYVREGAIESESVNALSWLGEVFWRRLINRVDDFGRFTANPELLRASLFPLQLDKVSVEVINSLLAECEQVGLLSTWSDESGKTFLNMHKWERGRAISSKYPSPPANICERMQTYVYRRLQIPPTPTPTPIPTPTPGGIGGGGDLLRERSRTLRERSENVLTTKPNLTQPNQTSGGIGGDSVFSLNGDGIHPERKPTPKTPDMLRVEKLFRRKQTTQWSKAELKAWKDIGKIDPEDFQKLEEYYNFNHPREADYRRRDLVTLLNNWNGEIDRARKFKAPTCL